MYNPVAVSHLSSTALPIPIPSHPSLPPPHHTLFSASLLQLFPFPSLSPSPTIPCSLSLFCSSSPSHPSLPPPPYPVLCLSSAALPLPIPLSLPHHTLFSASLLQLFPFPSLSPSPSPYPVLCLSSAALPLPIPLSLPHHTLFSASLLQLFPFPSLSPSPTIPCSLPLFCSSSPSHPSLPPPPYPVLCLSSAALPLPIPLSLPHHTLFSASLLQLFPFPSLSPSPSPYPVLCLSHMSHVLHSCTRNRHFLNSPLPISLFDLPSLIFLSPLFSLFSPSLSLSHSFPPSFPSSLPCSPLFTVPTFHSIVHPSSPFLHLPPSSSLSLTSPLLPSSSPPSLSLTSPLPNFPSTPLLYHTRTSAPCIISRCRYYSKPYCTHTQTHTSTGITLHPTSTILQLQSTHAIGTLRVQYYYSTTTVHCMYEVYL